MIFQWTIASKGFIYSMQPPQDWGAGEGESKLSILARGEGYIVGGVTSFWIFNILYFRYIWKMHLLSSDKISFSMVIYHKCLEHSVVILAEFFWSNLHLMIPPIPLSWNSWIWSFFSSILGIETFFGGRS